MKVLVIKPTALGDVAQALLVAPQLKMHSFCSELVWLIDEDYRELVQSSPLIDRVILFPRRRWTRSLLTFLNEIIPWLRALRRERFDLVVDLQGLARSGFMTLCTGAERRVGLASAREGSKLTYTECVVDDAPHAVARYQQAIAQVLGKKECPLIFLPKVTDALPHGLTAGAYTVIHPYSLWPTKLWPWERNAELVSSLPEEKFVLVGKGTFFPVLEPNCLDLRGQTNMAQLITLLSNARVVLSMDSGPLHVASVLGVPVLGLFGSTSEKLTAPIFKIGQILSATLPCRPCLQRQCSFSEPMACMKLISVADVRAAWLKLVNTI